MFLTNDTSKRLNTRQIFSNNLKKIFPKISKKGISTLRQFAFSDFNRYMKIQRLIETPFVFGTKAFEKKDATQSNEVYFDDAYKPKEEKRLMIFSF
jgi:hypothetical protein